MDPEIDFIRLGWWTRRARHRQTVPPVLPRNINFHNKCVHKFARINMRINTRARGEGRGTMLKGLCTKRYAHTEGQWFIARLSKFQDLLWKLTSERRVSYSLTCRFAKYFFPPPLRSFFVRYIDRAACNETRGIVRYDLIPNNKVPRVLFQFSRLPPK